MALNHHQVDVVKILAATETVGQVVSRVDRGSQLTAFGTLKPKKTVTVFGYRSVTTQPNHGQL